VKTDERLDSYSPPSLNIGTNPASTHRSAADAGVVDQNRLENSINEIFDEFQKHGWFTQDDGCSSIFKFTYTVATLRKLGLLWVQVVKPGSKTLN